MAAEPRRLRAERVGAPPPPAPMRVRVRGATASYFVGRHALAPDDAVAYTPRTRLDRWWFARLRREGTLRPAVGGWWLDLAAYAAAAERLSRRAVTVAMLVSLLIAAGVLMLYRG